MQVFINEFAKHVTINVILVIDGAGRHKGLIIPDNIEIIYLPPYSPELNPVERLWKYIKDKLLKNRIYNDLDELENAVAGFVSSIPTETIQSIRNCTYI